MSNVIVTGVTGFVGQYLTRELISNGYDVYAVFRNANKLPADLSSNPSFHPICCALEDLSTDCFPKAEYEAFFHLAWGGVNRDQIDNDDIHHHSFDLSVSCLETAIHLGCRCFLDAGSRTEYGAYDVFMDEELECHPREAYARWKYAFYQTAIRISSEISGFDYVHFRIFSVIGVDDHPWSIIASSCKALPVHEPMEYGACTHLWNFMTIRDAAKAIRLLFEHTDRIPQKDNHIVNIASYDNRVLRSFIEEIYILSASHSELIFHSERKAAHSAIVNPDKLYRITGWKSEISFSEVISEILCHQGDKNIL